MSLRLRFPELLDERQLSGYGLSAATRGKVSLSTVYRWIRAKGRIETVDISLLGALCEALNVEPGDLFEMQGRRRRSRG
jgi:DNA-binding Xre family transcriptional regulator